MQKHDAIIFECNDNYYIIQRSKQAPDAAISASENVALTKKLNRATTDEEIGSAVIEAINNYGKIAPEFSPWQLKELRAQLCKWTESKTYPALMRNSRLISVEKDFQHESVSVIPFDNFNINAWETLLEAKAITLPMTPTNTEVGEAVRKAFEIATYHPQKNN